MSRGVIAVPVFILVALSILFFSHYFIYFSLTHFFGIVAPNRRMTLAIALFLLPVSVIASSLIAHRVDNFLSRTFYFVTTLWLGVGLTLLTAFVVTWLLWGATKLFADSPRPTWFGVAALAVTSVYCAYGIWNAYHPRVKNLTVHIQNLPPAWQGKKIMHLSDVHLGVILGKAFLARLVSQANAANASAVFITGDLFDGTDGPLGDLVSPLNDLHAPQGIFFVTGNHETYLGVERACAALSTTPVRALNDESVTIDGLRVIGIGYPERGHSKDFAQIIAQLATSGPRLPSILLYHSPTHITEAKAVGINLQLAGHVHRGQIFPLQWITRLIYGKYYYGLHVEGGYNLYATSGAGTWGPTLRTGNHPEIIVIQLESSPSPES